MPLIKLIQFVRLHTWGGTVFFLTLRHSIILSFIHMYVRLILYIGNENVGDVNVLCIRHVTQSAAVSLSAASATIFTLNQSVNQTAFA